MYRTFGSKGLFVGLSLVFAFFQFNSISLAQETSPRLELGKPIEDSIEANNSKSVDISLNKDTYARFTSRQIGLMSFVRIYNPAGDKIAEVRNFLEPGKDNRVFLVTETSGSYRLEIVPLGKPGQKGRFKLTLEEKRTATQKDEFLMSARQSLMEAEMLHAKRRPQFVKQAIEKYGEAAGLFEKSGEHRTQADTVQYLGMAIFATGNLPGSLKKNIEARALYVKAEDRFGEASTLRGIGLVHHLMGDLDNALKYYEQGLAINTDIKNVYGEASDLGNIGGVYHYLGEYQKALDYYGRSLDLARKYPNKTNEARLLNNIGEVHRLMRRNEKALEYLTSSLKLRREVGHRRGEGNTLNNIGLVYTALKNYPKAFEYMDQSLKIRREIGDRIGEGSTLNNIGFLHFKSGSYEKALENLNPSLELKQKSRSLRSVPPTLYILGRVYDELDQKDKARDFYNQALKLSRKVRHHETEAAALKSIADLEREQGNLDRATRSIKEAVGVVEALRSSVSVQSLRTSFFSSGLSVAVYESYIDILMKQHEARPEIGYDIEALEMSEKSRARSLVDILSRSPVQVSKGVNRDLVASEKKVRWQINRKEGQLARLVGGKGGEERVGAIETEITNLLRKRETLNARIKRESPEYAELISPYTLDLIGIRRLLDDDSLILEFSLGEKQSYAWLVTSESSRSYKLAGKETIEKATRRVYDLLTARNHLSKDGTQKDDEARIAEADRQFSQAVTELSKLIVEPLAGELNKKRIVVIADGAIQYIPFSALSKYSGGEQTSPSEYRPLILDHEIVSLPSASTLGILRKRSQKNFSADSVAVIADPVFSGSDPRVARSIARLDGSAKQKSVKMTVSKNEGALGELKRSADDLSIPEFRRLRFSRREASDITDLVPEDKKLVAVDFEAERDLLLGEKLNGFRILHFATHGLLNSKNPELSGIVFSLVDERGNPKNGFLRLHDIFNIRLGADLVVLSACQTALGKDVKGEGLIGLTRGFMYAGAKSVVASLWKVEDRATAELMKRFYREMLVDGEKPSAALRNAQVQMWREKRWGNPYYWAAFTLQGDWR